MHFEQESDCLSVFERGELHTILLVGIHQNFILNIFLLVLI